MVHLVQPPLAAGCHSPLGCPPLLVPELPLCSLVTEDLDLGVAPVGGRGAHISPGVIIGVNLNMQRQTLHSFLCTETEQSLKYPTLCLWHGYISQWLTWNQWKDIVWQDSLWLETPEGSSRQPGRCGRAPLCGPAARCCSWCPHQWCAAWSETRE